MDRPTKTEIRDVAKSAAAIFAKNGLTSALFGGAACEIYGCTRNPNVSFSTFIAFEYMDVTSPLFLGR